MIVLSSTKTITSGVESEQIFAGQKRPDTVVEKPFDWDRYYTQTLEYIKSHEGLNNGKKYIDAAGIATIGYGHVILPDESFPDQISDEQADSLLRSDFDKALTAVDRLTDLKDNKRLAIAHFIYAKGVGHFSRSTLRKKIAAGEAIDDEIIKWCYYHTPSGKLVESSYSRKAREWELALYNMEPETIEVADTNQLEAYLEKGIALLAQNN